MNWRQPDWDHDARNLVARTEIPEAGGWIYRYRDSNSLYSHVFVPDVQVWATAISNAMGAPKTTVVSVVSNLAAATHKKQPVPT